MTGRGMASEIAFGGEREEENGGICLNFRVLEMKPLDFEGPYAKRGTQLSSSLSCR
jgi:hypothetical protein